MVSGLARGAGSVVCVLCVVLSCWGCNGPTYLRLRGHVARPNPRVILFFADGVNRTLFRQWVAQGKLPNIKKYIIDRGTEVENAVSCLPSITYANTATFLTGRRPGHHGVPANKWFDRRRCFYQDYSYGETYRRINDDVVGPTIYELLPDRYTVSVQSPLTRGANRTYYNDITAASTWWLGLLDWTDRLMPLRFEEIAQEVSMRADGGWPSFVHTYFPATDEYGHLYGAHSWQYRYAVRNMDHQIWRICDGLERAGLLERTTLVFASDHGMVDIERGHRFYVKSELAGRFGKRVPRTWPEFSTDYHARREYLDRYDTIVTPGGGRKCAIYLRFGKEWSDRPANIEAATTFTLGGKRNDDAAGNVSVLTMVRWLADHSSVHVAAVPMGPDKVALHAGNGVSVVERKGALQSATYRYTIREGSDPLGYAGSAEAGRLIDGEFHSGDDWFAATVSTDAPDIPGQICEMFDSERTGDIMLFAARGWAFSWKENAGHGSVTAEEMFVPMVWAGPGIAVGGKIDRARTCDVMPTILDLLGVSDRLAKHPPIDGVSLLPKLMASRVVGVR